MWLVRGVFPRSYDWEGASFPNPPNKKEVQGFAEPVESWRTAFPTWHNASVP